RSLLRPRLRTARRAAPGRRRGEGRRRRASAASPRRSRAVRALRVQRRASCRCPRECDQLVEARRRSAGVDGHAGELHALAQLVCVAACCDRARRIQQDRTPPAAFLALEDAPDQRRVLSRGTAGEVLDPATVETELLRIERPFSAAALDYLAYEVRPCGRS